MNKKILIVDDEPAVLKILKKLLEQENYSVISATGGFEAFDLLQENLTEIGLVLSDVKMPKGSGLDFLGLCRANNILVPVLLISGMGNIGQEEAKEKGAIGIVSKPYDFDKLLETVKLYVE